MGLMTAASLKAATTIQIDRLSGFLRCFDVTALPSTTIFHDEADTNNGTQQNWFQKRQRSQSKKALTGRDRDGVVPAE